MNVGMIKTGTYCLMHLTVAIAVAYALTGSWKAALTIGVIEPFVQTFFFAGHDRFWARYDGRGGVAAKPSLHGGCTHGGMTKAELKFGRGLRSVPVLKTTSYGLMHLVVAVAVAFALTRNWQAALAIGMVEPFVQTFAFTLHDKIWSRFDGRAPRRAVTGALEPARVIARQP